MSMMIHQSGIDAAINAQADGFSGATLSYVDLFDGNNKIKRLDLVGVQVIEPSRIYVVAQDSTTESYDVTKMDFITDGGALFATVQHDDGSVIQSKGSTTTLILAEQLNLSAAPGSVAPSGDVSIYAPQATESLLGTAEIATQDEANGSTDDTRFITPKKLYNRTATTSRRGVVELATQSETDAGTSTSRVITAATLKSRLASFTRNATETIKGFVEIATQTEANGGTDDTKAITPKKLNSRTATESRRGVAEVATQAEADAGTDDSRIITPKKLWSILTSKFARTDVRPKFNEGINTGGKPIVYSGSGTNLDHIWYDDGDNEFHMVADASEGSEGNANLKLGGIQLSSGTKVTGVSDSATSTSSTTLATSKAVDVARDDGTRQATESTRGQAEIATQAEVDAGTTHTRMVTPKTLASRLNSFARNATESIKGFVEIATQAEVNAGTNDSNAVTPKKLRAGFSYNFSSDHGYMALPSWLGGFIFQWGISVTGADGTSVVTFPVTFPTSTFITLMNSFEARFVSTDTYTSIGEYTQTSAKFYIARNNSGVIIGLRWFAIGH
ncbi:putative bacteriophage tail fiber protein [Endozoicomonas montiporae CL-33]|uniref:Putative bacteriophage tail fiber protein n=1 Tax=Endozoicomonas montiporae CL-33 TaxID=570277 RepID=A0A142BA50_9GAMM|nr:hypothetical protein [Endozoicomonas montiporae]AMO55626.1 putative bacteriophage tail fiber protein [Endozoicomonas montiporae CL-33]